MENDEYFVASDAVEGDLDICEPLWTSNTAASDAVEANLDNCVPLWRSNTGANMHARNLV